RCDKAEEQRRHNPGDAPPELAVAALVAFGIVACCPRHAPISSSPQGLFPILTAFTVGNTPYRPASLGLIDNGRRPIHLPFHDRRGPDRATTSLLSSLWLPCRRGLLLQIGAGTTESTKSPPRNRGAVMSDSIFTISKSAGGARYEIDTDKARLDRAFIHHFLARSHWAKGL